MIKMWRPVLGIVAASVSILTLVALGQQFQMVTPQQAAREEGLRLGVTPSPNGVDPIDFLSAVHQCVRPVSIEVILQGKRYLRVYEFQTVSGQMYRLQGVEAIATALRRAQLKARSTAVQTLRGLHQTMQEMQDEGNEQNIGAQETSTSGGALAGTSFAQAESRAFYGRLDVSRVEGFLKGAVVSGTKVISFGENAGLCVMVRLDVPLSSNTGEDSGSGGGVGGSGTGGGRGTPFNPGGAPPLPPGQVGDW